MHRVAGHDHQPLASVQPVPPEQAAQPAPEVVGDGRAVRQVGVAGQVPYAHRRGHQVVRAYGPPFTKPIMSAAAGPRITMNRAGKIRKTSGISILTAALWAI